MLRLKIIYLEGECLRWLEAIANWAALIVSKSTINIIGFWLGGLRSHERDHSGLEVLFTDRASFPG